MGGSGVRGGVLLGRVFPVLPVSHCTANNFSSLGTIRCRFSSFWAAICELGQQNKANETSSLAYHRPLLSTAVHAERTSIRDTIKTDLSKCFLLFCCCCLFECERLGCLEVKRTMLHLLFLLFFFISYITILEYQEQEVLLTAWSIIIFFFIVRHSCCWRYRVLALAVILSYQIWTLIFMASLVTSHSSCQFKEQMSLPNTCFYNSKITQ